MRGLRDKVTARVLVRVVIDCFKAANMSIQSAIRLLLLTPWLVALCVSDVRNRRLPNVLTLGGLAFALVWQTGWAGMDGLLDALAAAGWSALFLLLPFLIRAAGAGDVKMLAACGAFIGCERVFLFLVAVSFAGFFVALTMFVFRRATAPRLKHFLRCVFDWRYDRASGRAMLPPRDDERSRVPFGVAIAIGVWTVFALEAVM